MRLCFLGLRDVGIQMTAGTQHSTFGQTGQLERAALQRLGGGNQIFRRRSGAGIDGGAGAAKGHVLPRCRGEGHKQCRRHAIG